MVSVTYYPHTDELVEEMMARLNARHAAPQRQLCDAAIPPPPRAQVNLKFMSEWYNPYCRYPKVWL